jgi:DUF917 family protein
MISSRDGFHAEDVLRVASMDLGSLAGMCLNPIRGTEARTLPQNSFSYGIKLNFHVLFWIYELMDLYIAWSIGRSMALSRLRKQDPAVNLVRELGGVVVFSGKIISVTRKVSKGFTRGSVLLESSEDDASPNRDSRNDTSLFVEFENENLCALLRRDGKADKVLAVCPDLITFLDKANGAPLGISDYKYGLRVSVVALRAPPFWATYQGLRMGGPIAFA